MEWKERGRRPEEKGAGGARGIGRTNGFSDAVFAVAMTLLAPGIGAPMVADAGEPPSELTGLRPESASFVITFLIVGFFWLDQHPVFDHLRRYAPGPLWPNPVFLLFIVLLPFTTSLLSEHSDSRVAVMFHGANMACASLGLCLLGRYMAFGNGCRTTTPTPPGRSTSSRPTRARPSSSCSPWGLRR